MKALKDRLLNLNFVLDNEFLDKYIDLINDNLETQKLKSKTQMHHAIPVFYYKKQDSINSREARKLADLDANNIIVNLTHANHILAHWYLFKCVNSDYYRYVSSYALFYMLNITELPEEESDIIQLSVNYGEVYSQFCLLQSQQRKGKPGTTKGRKASDELRKKLSEAHKGIKQSEQSKVKRSESLKKAYAEGRKDGSKSDEQRKKISETLTGSKVMHLGDVDKHIPKDEVDKYLNLGWEFGQADNAKRQKSLEKRLQTYHVNNDNKLRVRVTNGSDNKVAHSETELKAYLDLGYWRGLTKAKPVKVKSYPKYTVMNDTIKNYRIKSKEEVDRLLQQGYILGTVSQYQKKLAKENLQPKQRKHPFWTQEEYDLLEQLVDKGLSDTEIQQFFPNRSVSSICDRRVSILKRGSYVKPSYHFICDQTGKEYHSLKEAAEELDIHSQSISNILNKKCKSAKGYTFTLIKKE